MGTILIVEDDEDSRSVLRALLESEGYRVAVARNGRAALELLRVFVPSVIVLDLRMPELDGWGFDRARAFLPIVRDVPVIVVSAFSHSEARLQGLDAEFFLRKPLNFPLFLRLIRALTAGDSVETEDAGAAAVSQLSVP